MSLWLSFRFHALPPNLPEDQVPEQGSITSQVLLPLIFANPIFLKKNKLTSPFLDDVMQWKPPTLGQRIKDDHGNLLLIASDVGHWITHHITHAQDQDEVWRGPSRPFDPDELINWAVRWRVFLSQLTLEQWQQLFFHQAKGDSLDIRVRDMRSQVLTDLHDLLNFAQEAKKISGPLVMEVL
jgi:hypothetical protein